MEETHALGLDSITLVEDDIPENNCNTIGSISTNIDSVESHLGFFPKVGMTFENVDELKKFYKQHAIISGFGVRIRTSKKDDDNELCYVKPCVQHPPRKKNNPDTKKGLPCTCYCC